MMPKDYVCDGQMNLWEYMQNLEREEKTSSVPMEEPEVCTSEENLCECEDSEFTACWDPSDSENEFPPVDPDIASGKKKPYEYDFERYIGQKVWCYLNEYDEPQIGEITAFDHYYTEVEVHYEDYALTCRSVKPCILPSLEETVAKITEKYGLKFVTYEGEWNLPDNTTIYKHVFKKHSVLEISESHYWSAKGREAIKGARFIAVDWDGWHESVSRPCDDLAEVFHAVEFSIYRNDHAKKPKKDDDDE